MKNVVRSQCPFLINKKKSNSMLQTSSIFLRRSSTGNDRRYLKLHTHVNSQNYKPIAIVQTTKQNQYRIIRSISILLRSGQKQDRKNVTKIDRNGHICRYKREKSESYIQKLIEFFNQN